MIIKETRIVVPNPMIRFFLMDMFLKFMVRFLLNFPRAGILTGGHFSPGQPAAKLSFLPQRQPGAAAEAPRQA